MNWNTAITALGFLFAIVSFRADHTRRKKQATVEHMKTISDQYHNKWRWLTDLLFEGDDTKNLTEEKAREIKNDEIIDTRDNKNRSVKSDVRDLLSLFEHLSVAITLQRHLTHGLPYMLF